jgi:hypothetical protein
MTCAARNPIVIFMAIVYNQPRSVPSENSEALDSVAPIV